MAVRDLFETKADSSLLICVCISVQKQKSVKPELLNKRTRGRGPRVRQVVTRRDLLEGPAATESRFTNKELMHTKRYRKLTVDLCELAVLECFQRKWKRTDVVVFIEKYAGICRQDIVIEDLEGKTRKLKLEAAHSIGLMLYGIVEDLAERGIDPEDMEPPKIRSRKDGMTGKTRDIAMLCILHQLLGHVEKLMIEPLIMARLMPTQHASIPGRGQTLLKDQVRRYLLKETIGVRYVQKTDVVHAYATLKYKVVVDILKAEIPKAKEAITLMDYLGRIAPGGHLIIGGYIDAWVFNLTMSYAIRDLYRQGTKRRGKTIPYVIRVVTFMDDFALLSGSVKGTTRAVKHLNGYFRKQMGIELKTTSGVIKFLAIDEEKHRRYLPKKAQRGVPMLDMAGYRVSRTHTTIRRRVFRRARRQLIRGNRELIATGTLRRDRAQKIISYNGYVVQSDSVGLMEKYNVEELMRVANAVAEHYQYLDTQKRKERLYVLQKRRGRNAAERDSGKPSGREGICAHDGERRAVPAGRTAGADDVPF